MQDYPHELMKIVLVDNGSTDRTLSLLTKFAQQTDIKTQIASSKGKGLAETRQIAVNNAEGDYILWTDDDHVLPRDFVSQQVAFMDKNSNLGAAAGVNVRVAPQSKVSIITAYIGARILPVSNPSILFTCGSIFRLSAIERVGGFDTAIKGALEDSDVSYRIRAAGWALAFNELAHHYHSHNQLTYPTLLKKMSWYGYGYHYCFHKFRDGQWSIMPYLPPFVLYTGLKMALISYRKTRSKKVFAFLVIHSSGMLAHWLGFNRAHLKGYGHASRN
jgi:glycosyltransferase involved in cell wall biosynthesis